MPEKWVNLTPGVPTVSQFNTTRGLGAPLCIDESAAKLYFLKSGDIVTPLAGGTSGSGTFLLDDGTAAATGVFSFNDGAA